MSEFRQIFLKQVFSVTALIIWSTTMASCVVQQAPPVRTYANHGTIPNTINESNPSAIPLLAPKPLKEYDKPGAPLTDFVTANFVGSSHCAKCHNELADSQGNDVSIADYWRSTMMANAAKDPLWRAKVQSEVARNPSLEKVIKNTCVICHMPMAWTQVQSNKNKYASDDDNSSNAFDHFLDRNAALHETALDGVSCSLCHQIQQSGLGTVASYSGQFVIDTSIPAPQRPIFGPYTEVYQEAMISALGYTPTYGPQTTESALCATCHTLYVPYVDAEGTIQGKVPEQTVYLEWLQSAYGKAATNGNSSATEIRTCQDCHMPLASEGKMLIAKPAHEDVEPKERFNKHNFVGGNVLMMNILNDHIAPLGLSASGKDFQATRNRTLRQLQTDTARVSLQKIRRNKDELTAVVRVENLVGHKFPSGFPSRRTWIHFTVINGLGEKIFESGQPRADGSIAGDNSDENNGFEPHYDFISKPEQVQIYETLMRDTDGQLTFTLLRGAEHLKDNRLLPYGFNKRAASPDIRVTGRADQDENFTGGSDMVTFSVPLGIAAGPYTVRAEILYTPVSYAFINDLQKDDNQPAVHQFQQYYDKADRTPVTVAATEQTVR